MTSLTCTFSKNLSMVYDHYIYLQENHLVKRNSKDHKTNKIVWTINRIWCQIHTSHVVNYIIYFMVDRNVFTILATLSGY